MLPERQRPLLPQMFSTQNFTYPRGQGVTDFNVQQAVPSTTILSSLHAHPRPEEGLRLSRTDIGPEQKREVFVADHSDVHPSRPTIGLPQLHHVVSDHIRPVRVSRRKNQASSQGTLVVNPTRRHQSRSPADTGETPTNLDDRRRRAESEYYEHVNLQGRTRRCSMLRTVSREDTLLGRGANPRTGLITPGNTSIDDGVDQEEVMEFGDGILPPMWRQKGDQWICINNGETSPLPTPVARHDDTVSRKVRIHTEYSAYSANTSAYTTNNSIQHDQQQGDSSQWARNRAVPSQKQGTQTDTSLMLSNRPDPSEGILHTSTSDPQIRRKPVAKSHMKEADHATSVTQSSSQSPAANQTHWTAPRTPLKPVSTTHGRPDHAKNHENGFAIKTPQSASSIPTIRTTPQASGPFLGPRPMPTVGQEKALSKGTSRIHLDVDKELPCLPTSTGQSPLSPLSQEITPNQRKPSSPNLSSNLKRPTQRPFGPRSEDPDYLSPRSKKSPATNRNGLYLKDGYRPSKNNSPTVIPSYDNPPREPAIRLGSPGVEKSREINPAAQGPVRRPIDRSVSSDPFITTSMTTNTHVLTGAQPPTQQGQSQSRPNLGQTQLRGVPLRAGLRATTLTTISHEDINTTLPLPVSRVRPRGLLRPAMPVRAAGLHHVPKVREVAEVKSVTHTDEQLRLNMIGMPRQLAAAHGIAELEGSKETQKLPDPEKLTQDLYAAGDQTRTISIENLNPTDASLTRRCSRCHNGYVVDKPLSTGGFVEREKLSIYATSRKNSRTATPSLSDELTCIAENNAHPPSMSTTGDTTNYLTPNNVDMRDHDTCCSECCRLNCHKGCLGHPPPVSSLCRSESSGFIDANYSEAVTPIPGIHASIVHQSQRKKCDRLPAIPRESKHKAHDGKISPDPTLSQKVESPPFMWSGDGASGHFGAASAAKRAIGLTVSKPEHVQRSSPNGLCIPKLRSVPPSTIVKTRPKSGVDVASKIDKVQSDRNNTRPGIHSDSDSENKTTSSGRKTTPLAIWTTTFGSSGSRNVSVTSVGPSPCSKSQVPTMSINNVWDLLFVPFGAALMWVRNNPQIIGFGWQGLEVIWGMACVVHRTAQQVLDIMFAYSKTGQLKLGKQTDGLALTRDLIRSLLFVVVFSMMCAVLGRVLRCVVLPVRIVFMVLKVVWGGIEGAIQENV